MSRHHLLISLRCFIQNKDHEVYKTMSLKPMFRAWFCYLLRTPWITYYLNKKSKVMPQLIEVTACFIWQLQYLGKQMTEATFYSLNVLLYLFKTRKRCFSFPHHLLQWSLKHKIREKRRKSRLLSTPKHYANEITTFCICFLHKIFSKS